MDRVSLTPFFLHIEQVMALLGPARAQAAAADAERRRPSLPSTLAFVLGEHLAEMLPTIPELGRAWHDGTLAVGDLVGIQQAFYFRRAKERDSDGYRPIEFQAALSSDEAVKIVGSLNAERCPTSSGEGNLSRRQSVYLVGNVRELTDGRVTLHPVFAGLRAIYDSPDDAAYGIEQRRRVYPSQIDQFSAADFTRAPTSDDLQRVLAMPEAAVKAALADILGEPFTQKDWGGERSDLYTARLAIDGVQTSSAWLLKGPSFPRPMTIAALGKPGDQIDRLYSEPAELLVLQHCHQVRAAVVNMMETYAWDMRRPRRYMVLDGGDTGRLLRAYGKLAAPPG